LTGDLALPMYLGLKSSPDFQWLKQDGRPFENWTKIVPGKWLFEYWTVQF
jgi:hypothetical protein